jgi:hypothetical protein
MWGGSRKEQTDSVPALNSQRDTFTMESLSSTRRGHVIWNQGWGTNSIWLHIIESAQHGSILPRCGVVTATLTCHLQYQTHVSGFGIHSNPFLHVVRVQRRLRAKGRLGWPFARAVSIIKSMQMLRNYSAHARRVEGEILITRYGGCPGRPVSL